jgi:hypothetical protein
MIMLGRTPPARCSVASSVIAFRQLADMATGVRRTMPAICAARICPA